MTPDPQDLDVRVRAVAPGAQASRKHRACDDPESIGSSRTIRYHHPVRSQVVLRDLAKPTMSDEVRPAIPGVGNERPVAPKVMVQFGWHAVGFASACPRRAEGMAP